MIRFIFITLVVFFIVVAQRYWGPRDSQLPVIAITQIIEHSTLDTVREGLIKGLAEKGYRDGKDIRIVYQNAHGQMTTAAQIVQHFANLKPTVLVALSTQSAQLLQTLSKNENIPLVFSAVTDPVAARLVNSVKVAVPNITGVSDYMDAKPQLAMIKKFLPHIKNLGVLHNPSEVNSTLFLETFEKEAGTFGIKIIRSPLHNTNEAVGATQNLLGKVDALYFPNDNTAMAAVSAIVGVAHAHGTPLFVNDEASVEKGALAGLSYDRIKMGKDTAALVVKAMESKPAPLNEPTQIGGTIDAVVNKSALRKLKIEIPTDLKNVKFIP